MALPAKHIRSCSSSEVKGSPPFCWKITLWLFQCTETYKNLNSNGKNWYIKENKAWWLKNVANKGRGRWRIARWLEMDFCWKMEGKNVGYGLYFKCLLKPKHWFWSCLLQHADMGVLIVQCGLWKKYSLKLIFLCISPRNVLLDVVRLKGTLWPCIRCRSLSTSPIKCTLKAEFDFFI